MDYIKLLIELYKLKTNTSKTKEQIQKIQREKLTKVLEYAYDKSKYYKKTFQQAGIKRNQIKDLPISRFPIIDKKILFENFDDIITVSDINQEDLRRFDEQEDIEQKLFKEKYHVVHSSGSTGKPSYFLYDDKAWKQMLLRNYQSSIMGDEYERNIKIINRET